MNEEPTMEQIKNIATATKKMSVMERLERAIQAGETVMSMGEDHSTIAHVTLNILKDAKAEIDGLSEWNLSSEVEPPKDGRTFLGCEHLSDTTYSLYEWMLDEDGNDIYDADDIADGYEPWNCRGGSFISSEAEPPKYWRLIPPLKQEESQA